MPFVDIAGGSIEYRMILGDANAGPPLVFLHEGLGSADLWRDFPDRLARRLGRAALVYSRFGYGRSSGLLAARQPRFMHDEALHVLPALLDALTLDNPLLIGHSDGASIALIHAADAGRPVAGLVLMAPHVIVEEVTVTSIARVADVYDRGDLRQRLARHHARVDDAFLGWSRIWLSPGFRAWSIIEEARRSTAPMLLLQGADDEYGTLAQLDAIEQAVPATIPRRRLVLENCRHSPHRDQPEQVLDAIESFVRDLASALSPHVAS